MNHELLPMQNRSTMATQGMKASQLVYKDDQSLSGNQDSVLMGLVHLWLEAIRIDFEYSPAVCETSLRILTSYRSFGFGFDHIDAFRVCPASRPNPNVPYDGTSVFVLAFIHRRSANRSLRTHLQSYLVRARFRLPRQIGRAGEIAASRWL